MNPALSFLLRTALVAILLAAPLLAPGFVRYELTIVMAYGIAILGLNLLMGHAGQICLAQGALFGIGAYATAILNVHLGIAPLAALPLAALATGAIGILVGLPAIRLQGLQLAIITFGIAAAFPQLLLKARDLTGGVAGLPVDAVFAPAFLPVRNETFLYLVAAAFALLGALLVALAIRGPSGRMLRAQRDNPVIADALGVDLTRARLSAFALSSTLAGLGGGLFAIINGFVSPASFVAILSINLVIGSILGGSASIAGAFVGAAVIVYLPTLTNDFSQALGGIVYGVLLIVTMMIARKGIVGLILSMRDRAAAMLAGPRRAAGAIGEEVHDNR